MAARRTRPLTKKNGKKGGSMKSRAKKSRSSPEKRRARPARPAAARSPAKAAKTAKKKKAVPSKPKAARRAAPARSAPAVKARPLKAEAVKARPLKTEAVKARPIKAEVVKPSKAKRRAEASPPPPAKAARASSANGAKRSASRPSSPAPKPAAREPQQRVVTLPLPLVPPPKRLSLEERAASVDTRVTAATDDFRRRYTDSFDMSWIYHDSALEGVVYTTEELRAALSGQAQPVTDSGLQPTYDDIRRHKEAIEFVRDFATKKRLPVTIDVIKKIYLILHPEEADIKAVKYRKDIPQHRLYFHEYAPPDKIAYKVRQVVDWLNDPETRKTRNGIRIAARAHYDLLRVYPFPTDSGKVARLFMNLLLLRSGLPPSIIHSTERQRYYEALKGSATTVLQMVQESVENALASVEKLLDEHESRTRAFVS
jgi:hypothetical protein